MADNILWKGPRLLIPMHVDALVVSDLARQNLRWDLNAMNFVQIGQFTDVLPNLIEESTTKPGTGVTLHWALPDGFSQGVENDEGDLIFPKVPNRWLVIRNAETMGAWIIESDYLSLTDGANFYPDLANNTYTKIGKSTPLSDWTGDTDPQDLFLTAMGPEPGDPGYSAFIANINKVFSFYDDLSDLQSKGKISYSVFGWLSETADDPLIDWTTEDDWTALMNTIGWAIGSGDDYSNDLQTAQAAAAAWFAKNNIPVMSGLKGTLTAQTLCHGFVFDVNWTGTDGALQTGIPGYGKQPPTNPAELPQIAIGNTSIDAFSQLVEQELEWNGTPIPGISDFLEKFQYNLLDDNNPPSNDFPLQHDIHNAWFGSPFRGKNWIIEDPSNPDPPVVSDDLITDLANLNKLQETYDDNQLKLQQAQQDLYGLWWKKGWAATFPPPPPGQPPALPDEDKILKLINENLDPTNPDSQYVQVQQLQNAVNAAPGNIQSASDALTKKLPTNLKLSQVTGQPPYHANEPVIMIYGGHRSYKYGADDRFSEDGLLFTRFTGQTLIGIKVTTASGQSIDITADNIDIPYPSDFENNAYIPKDVLLMCIDQWIENYFLDTDNATAIADKALELLNEPADPTLADTIKKQQTLIWNKQAHEIDHQTIAELSGLLDLALYSQIPSLIGVNAWTAPWNPVYLAWQITWYPSASDPTKTFDDWNFDPTVLDYVWDTSKTVDKNNGKTFTWYTVLTPQTTNALAEKLNQYFAEYPDQYPDLQNFLNQIAQWDFISQALSGYNDMLLGKNFKQLNPVTGNDALKNLIDMGSIVAPSPDQTNEYPFMPIRAGHFQLSAIWLVDDFGQTFDPIGDTGRSFGNYNPILGEGLTYAPDLTMVQLPPRLMQDFKLEFNLIDAEDKNEIITANQGADPVCGWILPNFLDKGITVYDASGKLLGEILLVGGSSNKRLRWDPVPGPDQATVGTPLDQQILNKHLLGFVQGFIGQTDSAQAYTDLMKVIDETLWTIDPLGGRTNSNLSVLVGRPLALVSASLNYHLSGGPVYDQHWIATAQNETDDYNTLDIPVHLGTLLDTSDGLLGYFINENYQEFNSVYQVDTPSSTYVVNNPVAVNLDESIEYVTLLWDPRGYVNAITGVLPIEQLQLPSRFVEKPTKNMEVTFRTGPLITEAEMIRMPLPAEINGQWSWIQHTGVTTWLETTNIQKSVAAPQLKDNKNQVLKEGWLKLSDALGEGGN